jgi:hypothetical protein
MSVQPSRAAGIVSRVASHETPGGLADPSAPIPAAASLYQDYVSRGGNLVRMASQNNRVSAMDKGTTWLGTGRGIYLGQFPVFESCGSCVHRHRQNKQPRGPESQSPSASRQSIFCSSISNKMRFSSFLSSALLLISSAVEGYCQSDCIDASIIAHTGTPEGSTIVHDGCMWKPSLTLMFFFVLT